LAADTLAAAEEWPADGVCNAEELAGPGLIVS
jgi:hypothetical protein